ncbi:MAG TPA: sigma 54-interacting transcriptional regulator [Candidatus Paceibacterota bacterium]|nr:sigma 54-interacting transcriptional regulator [Verrucomicrobiota bacterium]HRY50261.1 sigma 54-interacting transcriptional regulator [Candidatus Paceibacterota bacterium]
METTSDSRFDPNRAAQLLIDFAHEHSLDLLLQKVVRSAVERPGMVCVQIWLIEKGDRCGACARRSECPDQARCLHLAAGHGGGLIDSAANVSRLDDLSARIPLGMGFVGRVAVTGHEIRIRDVDRQPSELVGFEWAKEERIRGCGAMPIVFRGEIMGALVGFTREDIPEESLPWGRIFADHIGSAIANARAFEEIRRLKAQLELQNTYLQEEVVEAKAFGDLVGQSAALRQVVSQIELVAPTEASVLILGETGTGKELVAHEIHRRSRRKDNPLVRVNCASIPKELFESEFFGHVKGAFTGAIKDRAGRFETAEGGTLFLDEIGDVPLEMQSKLLRVLQDRRYERVGDDRTRQADVRIVGATNRDLKKAVAAGRFREDLYYRLHVFPIQVAPLRDRKSDIPLLAKHFVELSVRELRCSKPRLTRAAVARLQSYDWPGNIRELRNVIERGVILARGGPLHFDLPVTEASPVGAVAKVLGEVKVRGEFLTEAEMLRFDRENLLAVLDRSGWKIKGPDGAAELLGVKPTTLLSRMKKMGLKRAA